MSEIEFSTDKSRLDVDFIFDFLINSYWGGKRTRLQVEKTIENSMCFGAYLNDEQIGFARVISDQVIFAYLADVFVGDAHQRKGYGKALMSHILTHPALVDVQQWYLKTWDAHALYQPFGFTELARPDRSMEKIMPNCI